MRAREPNADDALHGVAPLHAVAGGSLNEVPTLVRDPQPAEFEALLERRRRLGLDRRDEVWAGVLHVNPAPQRRHANLQAQLIGLLTPLAPSGELTAVGGFNLGEAADYRIPDAGLHRPGPDELYNSTAALVIEIVAPDDGTWDKLAFYAAHNVDELLIVDPHERKIHWLGLQPDGNYQPIERSGLIPLGPDIAERIDWPQ